MTRRLFAEPQTELRERELQGLKVALPAPAPPDWPPIVRLFCSLKENPSSANS
jgi:hypothetical protein